MGQHDEHDPGTPTQDDGNGKTAGENTQSQGGIGHHAAAAAGTSVNPQAGSPKGAVDMPGPSLDAGGGDDPHDGRAHHGFTGDDGAHQSTDDAATAASLQPGAAGDLGAQQDQRDRRITEEGVGRMSEVDTLDEVDLPPSPAGPKNADRVPGRSDDEEGAAAGDEDGYSAPRDSRS